MVYGDAETPIIMYDETLYRFVLPEQKSWLDMKIKQTTAYIFVYFNYLIFYYKRSRPH